MKICSGLSEMGHSEKVYFELKNNIAFLKGPKERESENEQVNIDNI